MPIQRGKRNKKPRRRGLLNAEGALYSAPASLPSASPVSPAKNSKTKTRRARRQVPLWVNALLGIGMVIFGIVVFAMPQKGSGTGQRLIFLVLYFLIAGLYLGKAYQQYRARQRG